MFLAESLWPRTRPTFFGVSAEFLTQSSKPLLKNVKPKCDRKPTSVVFTLFEEDEKHDEITLDFAHDFKMTDASAYTPKSEVVLRSSADK